MFGKKQGLREHPMRRKARTRMERLPEAEILNWIDVAGSGVAQALDEYRRKRDAGALIDAENGVEALAGAVAALVARQY